MGLPTTRRRFLGLLASVLSWPLATATAQDGNQADRKPAGRGKRLRNGGDEYALPAELAEVRAISLVLGRASDRSVTVSALAKEAMEAYLEFGTAAGGSAGKTGILALPAEKPAELILDGLQPNAEYFYRLHFRRPGGTAFNTKADCRFHTQRAPGSTFSFAVQGDSHPERPQMNDPGLYARTLLNAAAGRPDFYVCMGDDFSVDTLRVVNAETVAGRYALQRPFLGLVGQSAPLFLVNGNHEQASLFNFSQYDLRHDVAIWAQNARSRYFPIPVPDRFYTGDAEPLESIGPLRDYYAWTWGDALFVVLDCYWHSPAQVDSGFQEHGGGQANQDGRRQRDWWGITLGDRQYRWFKQTLEGSKAKYKFVFAHHVLGTGRGGIEECDLYEWGGRNRRGDWEFAQKRPGWELPVHQLMAKHGVSVFFQGHDHLFARQERDGVVYQEVPNPADPGYVAHNEDRYQSGVKFPNSGYLRVTVSPEKATVDYVRCYLPKDEGDRHKTGEVAHSYTVRGRLSHA